MINDLLMYATIAIFLFHLSFVFDHYYYYCELDERKALSEHEGAI